MKRIFLFGVMLVLVTAHSALAENWAVMVGVDRYYKIRPNLSFCQSDAEYLRDALLKYAGFQPDHIKTLFSEEATKDNIRSAVLDWLVGNVRSGDKVIFYFSGHGVQIRDGDGDEEDGYDESLVAYDSWLIDTKFILDDELSRWLEQVPTTNKMVILDCCHSGTGIRSLELDTQVREYRPQEPIQVTGTRSLESSQPNFAGTTLVSACDAHQVALESKRLGHGVFTYHLSKSLDGNADTDSDGRISIREAATHVVGRIKADGWEQDPQLEGDYTGKYLVGEGEVVDPYGTIVAIEDGSVFTLALGAQDNVTIGSLYAIFPASATSTEGVGKGLIEITEVREKQSIGKAFELQGGIQVGDKVVEYQHRLKFDNLRVRFDSVSVGGTVSELRSIDVRRAFVKALGQIEHIELVEESGQPAERHLQVNLSRASGTQQYRLEAHLVNTQTQKPGQKYALPFVWTQLDKAVQTLLSGQYVGGELEGAYALKRLSKLTNPANPPVKIDLQLNKGANGIYNIGDVLSITASVDNDCWLTLLDIGSSGKITVLLPNRYQPDNHVKANTPIHVPAAISSYLIQVGGPPGTETIKALATLEPLDFDELSMEDLKHHFKLLDSDASGSLSEKITGKDLFLVETDRWAETSVHFRVAPEKLYDSRAVLEISILE